MQHCTKVPLLLANIRRYTNDPAEKNELTTSLEKLETSLSKYLKNLFLSQLYKLIGRKKRKDKSTN